MLPWLLSFLSALPWENAYNQLTLEVPTPHLKFAKPFAGGTLRGLAILPRWVSREGMEFAQRFDCQLTPVLTYNAQLLGATDPYTSRCPGTSREAKEKELRAKTEEVYDFYLVGNFRWSRLPPEARYRILKAVKEGAGLVFVFSPPLEGELKKLLSKEREIPADYVLSGTPWRKLSAFEGKEPTELVKAYRLGKGRVVVLDYGPVRGATHYHDTCLTPRVEYDDPTWAEYECYHALLARAVVFAARKEQALQIEEFKGPSKKVNLSQLPSPLLALKVVNESGKPREVKARVDVFNPLANWEAGREEEVKIPPPGAVVVLPMPPVPEGKHFVLGRLLSGEGVLDWAWEVVEVEAPVGIEEAKLDKPSAAPGDEVRIEVKLSSTPPPEAKVALRAFDNFGRLLWREGREAQVDNSFTFVVPPRSGLLLRLWVTLEVGGRTWSRKLLRLPVPDRKTDDFLFVIWGHGSDYWVMRRFREQASKFGFHAVDLYYIPGYTSEEVDRFCRNLFEANLAVIPYMWRFFYGGKELVRKPCLTDPNYRAKVVEQMTRLAKVLRRYAPPAYTLGDENFLAPHGVDVCFSETCKADFRRYLKERYRTIERLNRTWGTNFPSFDVIGPITLSEAKEGKAYANWAEHRMHMESVFSDIHQLAAEAIKAVDEGARVGFDGPGSTDSFHGYDWAKLLRHLRLLCTYHSLPEVEIVRSLARPGTLLGSWYGGYISQRKPEMLRWLPWSMLLIGYNSAWYFSTTHAEGAFAPDLRPHEHFLWQLPEMWAIRNGIGKLIVNSRKKHDGVALLYSQPSVHAATLFGGLEGWREAHTGAILALRDLGVGFKYVSYRDLEERGAKALEGFKVLLLPLTQALSEAEANALREFVKGGGTIIADLRPGATNGVCRPVEEGMLSDLFGVRLGPPQLCEGKGTVNLRGRKILLPMVRSDASVKATTAHASGKVNHIPLVLTNPFGKGRAVLLNFALASYAKLRGTKEGEGFLAVLQALLEKAGVRPFVKLTSPGGKPARMVEVGRFEGGEATYIILLRDYRAEGEWKGRVALPRPFFVCDMRSATPLGRRRSFSVSLRPGEAKAFSLLPYRPKALRIASPKIVNRGKDLTIKVDLSADKPVTGWHVITLTFYAPGGKYVRPLSRKLLYPREREATVRIAFNDPRGRWEVRALDIASGLRATASLKVR